MRLLVLLLVLVFASVVHGGRDFYKILGIPKKASQKQIKKAYRKAAMEWHPDKHPDDQETANAKFIEINNAYEVLSGEPLFLLPALAAAPGRAVEIDPCLPPSARSVPAWIADEQKRAAYDHGGEEGMAGGGGPGGGGQPHHQQQHGHPGGGAQTWTFHSGGGGARAGGGGPFSDPWKIFKSFFGQGGGPGGEGGLHFGGTDGSPFGAGGGGARMPFGGGAGRGGGGGGPRHGGRRSGGGGSYSSSAEVTVLTPATFAKVADAAKRGSRVWLVKFYSPSCPVRPPIAIACIVPVGAVPRPRPPLPIADQTPAASARPNPRDVPLYRLAPLRLSVASGRVFPPLHPSAQPGRSFTPPPPSFLARSLAALPIDG